MKLKTNKRILEHTSIFSSSGEHQTFKRAITRYDKANRWSTPGIRQ